MDDEKLDRLEELFPMGLCIKHTLLTYETIERSVSEEV